MHVTTTPGVSLLKKDDETVFNYFLSFSPMAPFFGVPWRFADMFQPDPALSKAAERTAFKASETAGRMAEGGVLTAQRAAETAQRSSAAAQRMVEDAVEVAADGGETIARSAAENAAGAAKIAADAVEKSAPKSAPAKEAEPVAKVAEAAPKAAVKATEKTAEKAEAAVEAVAETADETASDAGKDLFGAEEDPEAGKPSGLLAKAPSNADDLKEIKGVGPKVEAELNGLGIYTFRQIAGLDEDNLAWLARSLGSVRGRGLRSDFVEQARTLAG
jgi:predicted flap endonuclease-1-like 5' DNA nuclease